MQRLKLRLSRDSRLSARKDLECAYDDGMKIFECVSQRLNFSVGVYCCLVNAYS